MVLKNNKQGFSLIELMVVVAVIAAIGAIGTPKFLSMKAKSSVRADTRDVYSAFKYAQAEAVKRSESICVIFDPVVGEYTLFIDNGAGAGGTADDALQTVGEPTISVKKLRPGNSFLNLTFTGNPGYNSRGLPLKGDVGSVDLNSSATPVAMKLSLSNAGHVKITVL